MPTSFVAAHIFANFSSDEKILFRVLISSISKTQCRFHSQIKTEGILKDLGKRFSSPKILFYVVARPEIFGRLVNAFF